MLFSAVLWIRIQHFSSILIRSQGFDNQKLTKSYSWEKNLIKYCNLLICRPPYRMLNLQEQPSAFKREHPALQTVRTWNFLTFYFSFVGHFCPPESGSVTLRFSENIIHFIFTVLYIMCASDRPVSSSFPDWVPFQLAFKSTVFLFSATIFLATIPTFDSTHWRISPPTLDILCWRH